MDHESFSGEEQEETPKHISLREFTKILGMIWILPVRSTGVMAKLSWIAGARRPLRPPEPVVVQRAPPPPHSASADSRCEQPGRS